MPPPLSIRFEPPNPILEETRVDITCISTSIDIVSGVNWGLPIIMKRIRDPLTYDSSLGGISYVFFRDRE